MAKFHFVEDYERLVRRLMWKYPLDEAMSRAVGGGGYEHIGQVEAAIVKYAGLRDGDSLIDLGCGSGRLASALGQQMKIEYSGIDVIRALLKYAKKKSPENYKFILNRTLGIPLPDASADMATAFSVFTHLLHHESYIYLEHMKRVVRPGGLVIFSFLEFAEASHWSQFEATVDVQRSATMPHLNQYMERSQIELWSSKIGYGSVRFVDGPDSPWGSPGALGQSVAILRN